MVVIGGGFAGMAVVRQLQHVDVDVLLIDRNGYNTFQPLLYQVATGGLNPGDVTYALRGYVARFGNTAFRREVVTGIDTERKLVHVEADEPLSYDYLVVTAGVTANYFGIPGAAEHSMTIYTRAGAIAVRDQVLASVENAAQGREDAVEPVVVIVGGGPTGVEMAGTLGEMRGGSIAVGYPELPISRVRVILVEMLDVVLGPFDPKLQSYAAQALRDRGVELRLKTSVKEVKEHSVVIGPTDGDETEEIPVAAVIWATGVTGGPVIGDWNLPMAKGGRIDVGTDLRVTGLPEVFAAGDVASINGAPLPQLAQPAIQGGTHVAKQIEHLLAGERTEEFSYKNKGTMATIGKADAVVEMPFPKLKIKGFPAWVAWVGLHIVVLTGNRNRLSTLVNLTMRYLPRRRMANVIMGDS
ncbi:NAD(P)/FAD-dependent oxidoreductase [Rhodococcus aerolatus]